MSELPVAATAPSRRRYQVALELARSCPESLGREIILTGSVSRGAADEQSDIEQVFYVDALSPIAERETWLRRIGARDIVFDSEPIDDGSIWTTFIYRNIPIEAGWQTLSAQEANLRAILAGEVIEHNLLIFGWIMQHALPLRSAGLLARWQRSLDHYPEALARRLIDDACELWTFPHLIEARWSLVARNDLFPLSLRLARDICTILRVLFALNRRWEPEWKWLADLAADLPLRPQRLVERINAICSLADPQESVRTEFELACDTLELVPSSYDVAPALSALRNSLRLHPR